MQIIMSFVLLGYLPLFLIIEPFVAGLIKNNKMKYPATTTLSAARAAATISGLTFRASLRATKFTAPPIYFKPYAY